MENETVLAIATVLLVIAGFVQVRVLSAQNRQNQLVLIGEYRKRWNDYTEHWARLIFIGREDGEYYQVAEEQLLSEFIYERENHRLDRPSINAISSTRLVCNTLSDVTLKVLQGQMNIRDVYPIFGTEVLRHCRALRVLLDVYYPNHFADPFSDETHLSLRREVQDWLIYHDGVRRRCLILIDLLWAEATRLNDLPPSDVRSAADAKKETGPSRRKRLAKECRRLNGAKSILLSFTLSRYLSYSEYQSLLNWRGISPKKLQQMEKVWTARLLRDYTHKPS